MAIERKTQAPAATTEVREKLTVASVEGIISLDTVSTKKNSNEKEYIATPFGAVYAKLSDVKPGLHKVVKLSNGALALNDVNTDDKMRFVSEQIAKFPNLTAADVRSMYNI